uniref:Transcription initiation factor IIF subunit alpha n=1 Tax=Cajanus cajan TaxID=3821 RepID=A0A151SU24_CAJCA|nr:Transcription initiation factor IIF subunit alpha [Cajanus cajan]
MSIDLLLKPSCGGCGSTTDLYESNSKHMTLCFTCVKTMAENKAKCFDCGATVTRLIREYSVRASTGNGKNYFIGRFVSGLPDFSKKKSAENKWCLQKDGLQSRQVTDAYGFKLRLRLRLRSLLRWRLRWRWRSPLLSPLRSGLWELRILLSELQWLRCCCRCGQGGNSNIAAAIRVADWSGKSSHLVFVTDLKLIVSKKSNFQDEDDEDEDNEEGGGLSKYGKELKKLLGRTSDLNESDDEDDDDDDDDVDDDAGVPPVIAIKQKDATEEEPADNSPLKAAATGTARGTSKPSKGKRKLNEETKASNGAPPKRVKTENEQKSSVKDENGPASKSNAPPKGVPPAPSSKVGSSSIASDKNAFADIVKRISKRYRRLQIPTILY